MDSASRRPQLPPIGFLEPDKTRREDDAYQERKPVMVPVPAASPPHQYPTHPPPPYSHPAPPVRSLSGTTPSTPADMRTPPESRRTSGDEKEAIKQSVRQSLPSISEALGVDSQPAYHSSMPSQTTPSSAHPPPPRVAMPSSPSPRSHGMEPPQPPPQHASEHHAPQPQHHQYRQDTPHQQAYPRVDAPRPYGEARPPLHVARPSPPRSSQHPGQYPSSATQQSPSYDQPAHQASSAMGPPSFPYGYQPYPPRFAQPAPTSNGSVATIYQPSTAAPPTPSGGWKSEGPRHGGDERPYGDSVKRQLDMYDLEGALNDITQTSGIMTDFARRYSDRLHQTARSGPTPSTLPSIVEIEDMMAKSRLQLDSLSKIREVVIAQQVAYDQQAAEQRQQQQKAFAEPLMPAHPHPQDLEDAKAGFAGSDPKKRRGRAAPPGRCHSCNRAETPEWRRGPDGARTLCNACGLHYAKLTRKQNNANKNAAVNNSNLRPKESMS